MLKLFENISGVHFLKQLCIMLSDRHMYEQIAQNCCMKVKWDECQNTYTTQFHHLKTVVVSLESTHKTSF